MKKLLFVSAVAFGTLFGVGAQAAPVAGLAAIQADAAQDGAVQKVWYRGGWGHHGYGYGHGYRYGHGYGYGRWGYRHYGRWGYRGHYDYDRGYYGGYDRRY